ncbi:MAG: MFS transporter, partial [Candidatus Nanopelagicales bacterium]
VISALAAGSALGAFSYGWISSKISRSNLIRLILLGTAISIVPMSLLPPLPILALAAFVLGLSWGPFNPVINTLIQLRVPPDQHGRVFGVQTGVFYAAPPLGMIATGFSAEYFGISATYIFLASVLVLTSILALATKSLRSKF